MATRNGILTLALTGILFIPAGITPAAAIDFDITAGLRLSDDVQLFLNLSNDHYHPDAGVAVEILHRVPHPGDDFPVLLFLAAESGRDLNFIWKLRLSGMSWSAILVHTGVGPHRLFVGMDRDPGPPYGNAWGHWRRNRRHHQGGFAISDDEFTSLVKIQITANHFGISPLEVVRDHRNGKRFERIAREHHGRRHGGKEKIHERKAKDNHRSHGKPHKKR